MIIEIGLEDTQIEEFELEKTDQGHTLKFSVEGTVYDVEQDDIEEALAAQRLEPVAIKLNTDTSVDGDE